MDDRVARFTALYDQHYPKVLACARAWGPWQAAEDVAAETFLVAWRRLADLPAEPLPWLLGVTANLVRNQLRAGGRHEALAERVAALSQTLANPDVADRVAERFTVRRALATLSERDRQTLTLVAWLDLTPRQAAAARRGRRGAAAPRPPPDPRHTGRAARR